MGIVNKKDKKSSYCSAVKCVWCALISIACQLLCCCKLLTIEKHRSVLFDNADYLFCDNNNQNYFLIGSQVAMALIFHDDTADGTAYYHYRPASFYSNSNSFSPHDITTNSNYVIVCGWDFSLNSGGKVMFFDKSLVLQKTYFYDSNDNVLNIVCNDTYLYLAIKNLDTQITKLHRLDVETFEDIVLLNDMSHSSSFTDGDFELFYDSNSIGSAYGVFGYKCNRTKMLRMYDENINGKILFTDENKLFLDKGIINVENKGDVHKIDNLPIFNQLYPKAYICGDKMVFAGLNYQPDKTCFSYGHQDAIPCLCGLKESYLFVYDLNANVLSSIKIYPEGTFLIDYDSSDVRYYYDGGLFINDSLVRECEKATIGPLERFSRLEDYNSIRDQRHYYLCFNENSFYGI